MPTVQMPVRERSGLGDPRGRRIAVLFSIVLAMAETAFTRMSRIRALALEEEGKKGAARLVARCSRSPSRRSTSCCCSSSCSQLTSATLLGVAARALVGSAGLVVGLVLQIVLFFVIGEVAPKTYAIQNPDRAALPRSRGSSGRSRTSRRCGWLVRGCSSASPTSCCPGKGLKQGPFVTEEDLRTMADVAADEEEIEREERRLIHSIFEFGDTVVREVMRPAPDMVAIDCQRDGRSGDRDGRSRAGSRGSRATRTTTDNIIGIVYLKDLVHRARAGEGTDPVRVAVRDACSCPSRSASPSCCARCARRSSTWRSSSTSTAGRRARHPRGPARGDRRRDRRRVRHRGARVERLATGRSGPRAAPRSTRSTRCSASSCPTPSGTRSAGSSSTCSATCPRRARPSGSRASSSAPSGSRDAGSVRAITRDRRQPESDERTPRSTNRTVQAARRASDRSARGSSASSAGRTSGSPRS